MRGCESERCEGVIKSRFVPLKLCAGSKGAAYVYASISKCTSTHTHVPQLPHSPNTHAHYTHIFTYTYIHTYIHSYIHTHPHAYMQVPMLICSMVWLDAPVSAVAIVYAESDTIR